LVQAAIFPLTDTIYRFGKTIPRNIKRMKHQPINRLTHPLLILSMAAITWTNPVMLRGASATITEDLSPETESTEIYVPPPEFGTPDRGNTSCPASLAAAINNVIGNQSNRWGILIESLDGNTTLYSHNADNYFIPASNVKIFTTAAILQTLDPETPIRSKSLRDWVTVTNQRSMNNYAEMLFRYIGGSQAAKTALTQLGVNPKSYRMVDGSGLSRQNAATPRALVETLRAIHFAPASQVFHASLPIAGISGTLKGRMRRTPAEGMVYAKTGTLSGVRALSGYMNHPQYGMLIFSIIANNSSQPGAKLVKAVDSIVLQMSRLGFCE
jgi:D-alanyl-D-alanine carboxypeptidase/D-alanyl-D-alanine-endopeptidase (penicillin-binding protein 4)